MKVLNLLLTAVLITAWAPEAFSKTPAHSHNRQGRYHELLAKINCPTEYERPGDEYLVFGYSSDPGGRYCNQKVPKQGYWVYVYPHWYIWGREDLEAVGMGLIKQKVRLIQRSVTLEMAYVEPHRQWAETRLIQAAETIKDLERISGKPFPGQDPYRIEENPQLSDQNLLGQASHREMELAPPDESTAWTLTHEGVHIWNHRTVAPWVCEGLADTLGWLLMYENKFSFAKRETLRTYLENWNAVMETDEDAPLATHYDALPQGKAMQFWLMLYELYGPEFLATVLQESIENVDFGVDELRALLEQKTDDADTLLSGWLVEGPYYMRNAADFGPVRFKLPGGIEL